MNYNEEIKKIADFYDKRAKKGDGVSAAGQWGDKNQVSSICEEINTKIDLNEKQKVLEIGCGTGVLGRWLSHHCEIYVGCDISLFMLKKFKEEFQNDIELYQSVTHLILFKTEDYLDYESASGDRFPLFIKIRNEKKEIIGQLGVVIVKSTNAYSSPFLQQFLNIFSGLGTRALWAGGPIIHSNDPKIRLDVLKEVIKALERIAMQYNLDVISGYTPHQDLNIEDSYLNSFKTENYSIENFLTFAIDLTLDEETIWNGIDKNARRDVSRAEKRGIFVKELESFEELKDYFSLAEKWAVTKGISVKTSDEQIIKYWKYYQRGIEKIFLAYDNNELISSHRLGIFNKVAFI